MAGSGDVLARTSHGGSGPTRMVDKNAMVMTEDLLARLAPHQRSELESSVEETGMFDLDGRRVLYFLVRPIARPRTTGIVISHSYFELSMLQEAEIRLARRLAAAGYASIYVQAPGMGDSEGDAEACMLADRVAAALGAFQHLRSVVPEISRPCFFGARVGGLVATLGAQQVGDAALALWDPTLDPSSYWRQVRRLARIAAVVGGQRLFKDPQVDLHEQGSASVLGVEVTSRQLEDLAQAEVTRDLAIVEGPVLLVALDDPGMRAAKKVLSPLSSSPVDAHVIGHRDIWHLGLRRGKGALEPTVAWATERLL